MLAKKTQYEFKDKFQISNLQVLFQFDCQLP